MTRGNSAAQPSPKGPTQLPDHRPRRQWCLGWYSFRCASGCFLSHQLPIWIQVTDWGQGARERKRGGGWESKSIVSFSVVGKHFYQVVR